MIIVFKNGTTQEDINNVKKSKLESYGFETYLLQGWKRPSWVL